MTSPTDDDFSDFMDSLPGVRKLESDKVDLYPQKLRPKSRVRHRSHHSTDGSQQGQLFPTTESADAACFDPGIPKKLQRRIKGGKLQIEDVLDLHGYRQQQAFELLQSFLRRCTQTQKRFVLVIHGKGSKSQDEARLKPLTQSVLAQHPEVLAYCPATPANGGEGASQVYLRKHHEPGEDVSIV